MADIVIYGGEPGGIAAALTCARRSAGHAEVVLCFPEETLGGGLVPGGLQSWERRPWTHLGHRADPQGGSFGRWLARHGESFGGPAMAEAWAEELKAAGVSVISGHDIEAVLTTAGDGKPARGRSRRRKHGPPGTIDGLRLRPLVLGEDGQSTLGGDPVELRASVFIDASSTGRLIRLAGVPASIGRQDWNPDCRQMAAMLMFPVQGLDWDGIMAARDTEERPVWGTAVSDGQRTFWGGQSVAATDELVAAFHEAHPHFRLGSLRAIEAEPGTFWVQGLLVFGIDARFRHYDQDTERAGTPFPANALDSDGGYRAAHKVAGSSDLLGALRRFPGWEKVEVCRDGSDQIRSAQTLFLRETIHATGPTGFALGIDDIAGAGTHSTEGKDARHHGRRIGLGFYWLESVGYVGHESLPMPHAATNPVYLPLDCCLVPPVRNLLVCGYAAPIESRAWWAMRAAPNLCVLGDAAGAAAAYALREGKSPLQFGNPEVAAIQSWLQADGAILDKW